MPQVAASHAESQVPLSTTKHPNSGARVGLGRLLFWWELRQPALGQSFLLFARPVEIGGFCPADRHQDRDTGRVGPVAPAMSADPLL